MFSLFSVTKAITVVLVLRAIERGQFDLTTPISDLVPEFSGKGREKITIFHLLTHSSGLPSVYSAREGMYIDVLDEIIAEICKNIFPMEPPGLGVRYAPIVHHALMGDALRRIDPKKRSYRADRERGSAAAARHEGYVGGPAQGSAQASPGA